MSVTTVVHLVLCSNCCHYSVRSFEYTSELAVFDLCGVELYHGWLADPQDHEAYQVVSGLSYNQLVEKSLATTDSNDITVIQAGEDHMIHHMFITCMIM